MKHTSNPNLSYRNVTSAYTWHATMAIVDSLAGRTQTDIQWQPGADAPVTHAVWARCVHAIRHANWFWPSVIDPRFAFSHRHVGAPSFLETQPATLKACGLVVRDELVRMREVETLYYDLLGVDRNGRVAPFVTRLAALVIPYLDASALIRYRKSSGETLCLTQAGIPQVVAALEYLFGDQVDAYPLLKSVSPGGTMQEWSEFMHRALLAIPVARHPQSIPLDAPILEFFDGCLEFSNYFNQ